jgi:hypothetical protein
MLTIHLTPEQLEYLKISVANDLNKCEPEQLLFLEELLEALHDAFTD